MVMTRERLPRVMARARGWLPAALLILALSALFVFGGDRGYFYRASLHNENSAKNLALAENLSPRDNFRLFIVKRLAADGLPRYGMYSRFPIGGTALIKLAIAPFDGLSARLTAGRALALIMFCGAAVLAHLAVARLTASRWIGAAAALIAFSSYYALYYSDAVSNETAMDIFGVMLTFHGMVAFVQDGRFRQLVVKACAALLVGWHVYALLLAFIVFGLAGAIVAAWLRRRPNSANSPSIWNIREKTGAGWKRRISIFAALIRSRYMILGAATLAFGIVVLGANLVNEYYAYGGETPPADLPSLRSALSRAGVLESERFDLPRFARQQLYRAGGAALPYALPWKRGFPEPLRIPALGVAVGALALGAALAGIAFARRHRALWATLALFGFFWAILMRDNVSFNEHHYEALYYVGIPLTLFGLALMGARRLWGARAPVAAALAAAAIFAVSAVQMGNLDRDGEKAEAMRAEMADFDAIREKARDDAIAVELGSGLFDDWLRWRQAPYYLAGVLLTGGDNPTPHRADGAKYVISHWDYYERGYPLTPQNSVAFLYEVEPFRLPPSELSRLESAEPTARSGFDLYLEGDTLTYLKAPCAESDTRGRFFLSVHPVNAADIPEDRRALGHDSLNFDFPPQGIMPDGKCAMRRLLPRYPIASISTGQYMQDEGEIWSAEIRLPPSAEFIARYESVYEAAKSSGEPLIRSDFDVYMDAHALTYVKEPCAESDARGDFFLDIHPVNPEDLSEDRRELGYDDLAFDFSRNGIIFANKCMARREIPGYAIAAIATGMSAPDEGEIWRAEIKLPISVKSGDLIIRSDFDVYMEGDTLTYLKAPCAESDTRGRFFLSVHPVDDADLPEHRRELGHASLNFDFAPDGIIFADKCMIRRELPDYPIKKIVTGQWMPGVGSLWTGEAAVGD